MQVVLCGLGFCVSLSPGWRRRIHARRVQPYRLPQAEGDIRLQDILNKLSAFFWAKNNVINVKNVAFVLNSN